MTSTNEPVIVAAARTPIGRFEGALASLSAPRLGGIAVREAVRRSRVAPAAIDEVLLGQVLPAGVGQAPARQAALLAGIPTSVPCTTLNKVCGSGLKAAMLASQAIRAGDADVVVAGGMESMSNAPYLMPRARAGYRMGHQSVLDGMIHDALWDPFEDIHMGGFGDSYARASGFDRAAQDAYAIESYERARAAQEAGFFTAEIVPVETNGKSAKHDGALVTDDEEPRRFAREKLAELPPVFSRDGSVTAANASKINDGAAALVLMSRDALRRAEATPLATVLGDATYAGAAPEFPIAPARAIERAAARAGISVRDIDVFEISEAFALVPLVVMRDLEIARDKVNVWGGAISLGHPVGCSGARLVVTLLSVMQRRGARIGCAALCLGGGEAVAMILQR